MNYKQIYAKKAEREGRIKKICPNIPYSSGIYVFYRYDESGIRMAYCGQAVSLCERCASHLAEYDHIGLSLKKRGFYNSENPYGWKLTYKTCPKSELDEREKQTIKECADKGFQLYNKTAGGQGEGKEKINEYRPARGYRDGIKQGRKSLAKEIKHIIDTHLTVRIREDKENNKVSVRAFQKFWQILNEWEE